MVKKVVCDHENTENPSQNGLYYHFSQQEACQVHLITFPNISVLKNSFFHFLLILSHCATARLCSTKEIKEYLRK